MAASQPSSTKNAEGQAIYQSGDSSDVPFCETLTSGLVVTPCLIEATEVGMSRCHPSGQRHYNVQRKSEEDHLRGLNQSCSHSRVRSQEIRFQAFESLLPGVTPDSSHSTQLFSSSPKSAQ